MTLLPLKCLAGQPADPQSLAAEQAEALRGEYNQLIRTSFIADKVVDLDALLRDPDDPHRMQESMHLGDGVHPNWKGGAKMAAAVLEQCFSQ